MSPRPEREEKENWIWRWHHDGSITQVRSACAIVTRSLLEWCLENAGLTLLLFGGFIADLASSDPFLIGRRLLPLCRLRPDASSCQPARGTFASRTPSNTSPPIEREIRTNSFRAGESPSSCFDNIGLPNSGINLAFGTSATISNSDGEIQIALKPGKPQRPSKYQRPDPRTISQKKFPDGTFFFTPANITNQILDFGLPAPIDVQVQSAAAKMNFNIATRT